MSDLLNGATEAELLEELNNMPSDNTEGEWSATGNNTDGYEYPEFVVKFQKAAKAAAKKNGRWIAILVLLLIIAGLLTWYFVKGRK